MKLLIALSGCVLGLGVGSLPALAGRSLVECEFVGDRENLPGLGGGDMRSARPTRSRFAGAAQSLTEGPPAASGGPDSVGQAITRTGFQVDPVNGCRCDPQGQPDPFSSGGSLEERFLALGALPVSGADGRSVHDQPVFQNIPSCPKAGQQGFPAEFEWTFAISRPVVSDLRFEICPDVRKCQEEDDVLGQAATVPIPDFVDAFGPEYPPLVRVVHHRGSLWQGSGINPSLCACEDRIPDAIANPTLRRIPVKTPPWKPLGEPGTDQEIPNSVAFVGKDCLAVTIENAGRLIAPLGFVTLQLHLPASTRVRVRAAADSAAACYVGAILTGQRD